MALINITTFSETLEQNIDFAVIMPGNKNEKVLFLLHGFSGNHQDWIRYTSIERYVEKYGITVIMPSVNNSYYANMEYGYNYFDFVTKELPKIYEKMFNTKLIKKNTYIAGLSMGGYGALKAAFSYPEQYAGVASLSGAIDLLDIIKRGNQDSRIKITKASFGENLIYKKENDLYYLSKANDLNNLDVIITCGKEDFLYKDNISFKSFVEENNLDFKFILNDGSHTWEYWDENIQIVLKHFFNN